jgi:predicted transcriptional regulator
MRLLQEKLEKTQIQGFDEKNKFWAEKNLCTLPSHLLNRIGELGNCRELIPEKTHIFDYPPDIMDPLYRANTIMVISSFHLCYLNPYLDFAKKGIKVFLILEKPNYRKFVSAFRDDVREFVNMRNTELFVCAHKIDLASCIITDQFISFSIISKNGRFYNHEILSFEKKALSWGKELFSYYMDMSELITRV